MLRLLPDPCLLLNRSSSLTKGSSAFFAHALSDALLKVRALYISFTHCRRNCTHVCAIFELFNSVSNVLAHKYVFKCYHRHMRLVSCGQRATGTEGLFSVLITMLFFGCQVRTRSTPPPFAAPCRPKRSQRSRTPRQVLAPTTPGFPYPSHPPAGKGSVVSWVGLFPGAQSPSLGG